MRSFTFRWRCAHRTYSHGVFARSTQAAFYPYQFDNISGQFSSEFAGTVRAALDHVDVVGDLHRVSLSKLCREGGHLGAPHHLEDGHYCGNVSPERTPGRRVGEWAALGFPPRSPP
ncbi:hypothetical protein EVAR_66204_1 [Eumeta japonica]|uniref:Uncharacterized protein n=1 Tax=Eumeta variegata TaxID=151549 RepID=A0A4C1ZLB7_EUMVA|nr:hypothetical protein EVAR_66204_1 [Eumeta japonica]